jgi:hypothetical protein
MAGQEKNQGTPSSAYEAMRDDWSLIDDIMAGARRIRSCGEKYLPKFEEETHEEYKRRVATAPWRAEFADALRNLASKPFDHEVSLADGASQSIKDIAEDVDARGSNLTAFAREIFKGGIQRGMHAILVDFPEMDPQATRADERRAGARPYWVPVAATDILALYTGMVDGEEAVTHLRLRENSVERDGYGEKTVERVREFNAAPGTIPEWVLWRKVKRSDGKEGWDEESRGFIKRGEKTTIPLALFWTGERKGEQQVQPPLIDLAHMQIELYQSMSRKEEILTFAGSPMLKGKGFKKPEEGTVSVGPKCVVFAPPGENGAETDFDFIQPAAANIKEIREDIEGIIADMKRLGMQPLTPKSGNITATTTSVEAAKAHSAVEAWALGLKDVLEQAFVFTEEWLNEDTNVEVVVDTDFAVEPFAQAPLDALDKARQRKDISRGTYWSGLKRFGVLPQDHDADAEEEAIASEGEAPVPEVSIDPITGQPIVPPAA